MTTWIKKNHAFPIFTSALLLAWGRPYAVPLYYSFAGEVVYSNIASRSLGQTVNYTFLVDQGLDGSTLDGNGQASTVADYSEAVDWYTLSFYSAYLGGDALASDNPDAPIKESSFAGLDQVHYADDIFSAVRGSNSDRCGFDLIDIYSDQARIGDWVVGQNLRGENFVENAEGVDNSSYSSNLILTRISDTDPLAVGMVPEPSVIALFGCGLLGLGLLARRRPSRGSINAGD